MSSFLFTHVLAGVTLLFKLAAFPDLFKRFVTPFTATLSDDHQYKQLVNECCAMFGVDPKDNGEVVMVARFLYDQTPFTIHGYPLEDVIITQGKYEDYRIVGVVRGASLQEIESAFPQFKEKLYENLPPGAPKGYGENYYNNLKIAAQTMDIESEMGSFYDGLGEYFMNWIAKTRRCRAVDVPTFHVTES